VGCLNAQLVPELVPPGMTCRYANGSDLATGAPMAVSSTK